MGATWGWGLGFQGDKVEWEGPAGLVGWSGGPSACWAVAQMGVSFRLFFVLPFVFSFYLFFSVLIHLKASRLFIKMRLLHHNYRCNNRHSPNILFLIFENFYCRL